MTLNPHDDQPSTAPRFDVGQRVLVLGKHPAVVVGSGWQDPTRIWVKFGSAEVPSKILLELCEPVPDGE